jgi:Papain family cysteine protease
MRFRLVGIVLLASCLCGLAGARADENLRIAKEAQALYELDLKAKAAFEKRHPNTLPESKRKLPKATAKAFDWTKYGVTGPIYTQGRSPYCWAFTAVQAFECSWRIRNKGNPILAVQPIIDHTKKTGGADMSVGMKDLLLQGTAPLAKYPFVGKPLTPRKKIATNYRAVAYGYVGKGPGVPSTEALKEALLRHGPLVVGIYAGSEGFKKYKGGVYSAFDKPPEGEAPINHALLLVGWDDRAGAWKIKNSWDTTWGEKGHMWIKYGSNNVGVGAMWIRAQSTFYHLPDEAHALIDPEAKPFHRWPSGKAVKIDETP